MESKVYRIKRSFRFRSAAQARAFLEIANVYGRGRTFGDIVLYEASLEFIVWRKLETLAHMVSDCSVKDIDIYKMTSQAGFKVFMKAGQ